MRDLEFAVSRTLSILMVIVLAIGVAFAIIPAVIVLILSFSTTSILAFPPSDWTADLYEAFISSDRWIGYLATSFKVGIPAAALALVVSVPAAYGIVRRPGRLAAVSSAMSLGPLLVPLTAYSVGLYFVLLKFHMAGTLPGLVLAHGTLAIPICVLILTASVRSIPREHEMVAMVLGASRWRSAVGITVRMMVPALLTAFLFAFIVSFDDAVISTFAGGPIVTLSRGIFGSLRTSLDPVIAAISAIMMVATGLLVGVGSGMRKSER